jgi:urate oxidase
MLAENSYGKSGIRLVKLVRRPDRHEIVDLTVAVRLAGDFEAAHVSGDNSRVLPTDTMKNTVYALAADHSMMPFETFGLDLVAHFLAGDGELASVTVDLEEHPWEPLAVRGRPHPHAFHRSGTEVRTARIRGTRGSTSVEAGLDGLVVLKSAASAFSGFRRDRLTTLPETRDRIFATSVTARWRYAETGINFGTLRGEIRQALLETFAGHASESVQHTVNAMGETVLERHAEVDEIRISLPNKHHLPVDLSPFGRENRNEIFVATEEPYGLIEATLRRKQGAGSREQE